MKRAVSLPLGVLALVLLSRWRRRADERDLEKQRREAGRGL